mgnify:CR=1 FL=1
MDNRIIGLTASTFDLLHAGHISMLREAKSKCDYLICALQVDPSIERPEKNKPVKYVDEIIPYQTEEDLIDILQMYPIDIRIIGEEYRSKSYTGKTECIQLGINIYYNKRNHRFSSSGLRKRISAQK